MGIKIYLFLTQVIYKDNQCVAYWDNLMAPDKWIVEITS